MTTYVRFTDSPFKSKRFKPEATYLIRRVTCDSKYHGTTETTWNVRCPVTHRLLASKETEAAARAGGASDRGKRDSGVSEHTEERTIRDLWDIAMGDDPDRLTSQELAGLLLSQLVTFGPEDESAYPCEVKIQVPQGDGTARTVAVVVSSRNEVMAKLTELGIGYPV